MSSVRVLLADDHPLIIEGLTGALKRLGVKVLGAAENAQAAAEGFTRLKPDVLVLDVRFGPGLSGLDAAREILDASPEARIVFYSQFDQDEVIREAYRLGGAAFVTKNCSPEQLVRAIEQAHAGKTFFLPEIAERLALLGVKGDPSPRALLDERELEIFLQIAGGLTNNEIAAQMGLSAKTIGTIVQAIRDKLGVQRAADMTRLAVRYGLIEP